MHFQTHNQPVHNLARKRKRQKPAEVSNLVLRPKILPQAPHTKKRPTKQSFYFIGHKAQLLKLKKQEIARRIEHLIDS